MDDVLQNAGGICAYVRPSIHSSICPSMGLSKSSEGSKGQPEWSERFEGQLEGSEGQLEVCEGQPERYEGQPKVSEGQPKGCEGQLEGSEG